MKYSENQNSKYPLPQTISDFIYANLKKAITNNELKPNQRIDEKKIASNFHVSRTPVREAVLRLATEGFVQIDSFRRAIVKEISFQELNEILQLLGPLDWMAVDLVLDYLTPDNIEELEKLTSRMKKNCRPESIEKFLQLNIAFHNTLWEAVPNKTLKETLYLLRERKERFTSARINAFKKSGTLMKSMEQHNQLMEAIKSKARVKLKQLILSHRNLLLESSAEKEESRE